MAKTTTTQVTDDIDVAENAEEVAFSYGGINYTIDLAKKNKSAPEKALQPYLSAATKVSRRGARRRSTGGSRQDLAAVRTWARSQGLQVSDRGRVPKAVVEQCEAAN